MIKIEEIKTVEDSELSLKENLKNQYLFAMPMSFLAGMGHGLCIISVPWWLKSLNFPYASITWFALVNISFGLKFLWIPIFDRIDFTKLARRFFAIEFSIQRKLPMVVCIYLSSFCLFLSTFFSPLVALQKFSACIFLGAFWLANGETIMIAYNLETLRPRNMSITNAAYRIGLFVSSWTLLFLHESYNLSWAVMFRVISLNMAFIASFSFLAPTEKTHTPKTWSESLFNPYLDLVERYKLNLVFILFFIILYKARDRISDPVNSLFIRDNSGFDSYNFFALKFFSTFLLAASAIRTGDMIETYAYRKSFPIAIMLNFVNILGYFSYSFKNKAGYLSCMFLSILSYALLWYFTPTRGKMKIIESKQNIIESKKNLFFDKIKSLFAKAITPFIKMSSFFTKILDKFRLKKVEKNISCSIDEINQIKQPSRTVNFILLCLTCFLLFLLLILLSSSPKFSNKLPTMSIFFLIFSDKITYGVKSSVLYSYQASLCSRKYALSQATIMTSLELFTSYLFLQPFSGSFVDSLGWTRFYFISTLITILPLLMHWSVRDKP